MVTVNSTSTEKINYPSSDGEPVAETYTHLYAILTTLEVLKQYLSNRQATVLANQFMYYNEGFPRMRVAPDVMVIFDVSPGGRDNYKIWLEGQVPKVIFEMTSKQTQKQDRESKKTLYFQLGVEEYWLFDPKGEWIKNKLEGYRLGEENYHLIIDNISQPLQLRLAVEGELIAFYTMDSGEKLLIPEELAKARLEAEKQLIQERLEKEEALRKVAEMEAKLERYRLNFGDLPESQ